MKAILATVLAVSPALASAQSIELFYEEPLGGVYAQFWSQRVIGRDDIGELLVFIRGDGKSGDFYGVLALDCVDAAESVWRAQGGYLTPDSIPAPAIAALRAEICGSP